MAQVGRPTLKQEECMMDTTKWKSVLVPIEVYEQIKKLSKSEGRTISGQLRIMWEVFLKNKNV